MSGDPLDLTGAWEGSFAYPRAMPPNGFRASVVDHAGALTGEIEERSDAGRDRGTTIHALLVGRRNGHDVSFAKSYDSLARAYYAVNYTGTLNDEGTEISGQWVIAGQWSGSFIMTRDRPAGAAEEVRRAEEVR